MRCQFQAAHDVYDMNLPLSADEIRTLQGENDKLKAYVVVNTDDIMEGDIEAFDEIVSEKITGGSWLQDIGYTAVDVTEDGCGIVFEIWGFVDEADLEAYFD